MRVSLLVHQLFGDTRCIFYENNNLGETGMAYHAVIFDFNGTLFWDSEKHEAAWNSIAQKLRGYPFRREEILEQVHGRTNELILHYLLGGTEPERVRALSQEKETIYRRLCTEDQGCMQLAPGAVELFATLKEKQIPFTIATSSGRDNVDFYLEEMQLSKWFDPDRLVYDDGSMKSKPAPDIYQKAAAVLGIPAAHCLAVEDAVSGILSASRAGMGVVAVSSDGVAPKIPGGGGILSVIRSFHSFPMGLVTNSGE